MAADDLDHLVSQGWQRNFGTQDRFVSIVDARTGALVSRSRAIKSNFAEPGFMTEAKPDGTWNRNAERSFRRIEDRVFERIREIRPGVCTDEHRNAVIELCAIHLVRSQDFRDAQMRVLNEFEPQAMLEYPQNPDLCKKFIERLGSPPAPGVVEYMVQMWVNSQRFGAVHFDSVDDRIGKFDAQLRRWHLQVVNIQETVRGALALGDNPVVHADLATRRFGFRDGLAVGDANLIMAPLQRRVVVFFTAKPMGHTTVGTLKLVHRLNALTARAARNHVACHPDDARYVARASADVLRYLPTGSVLIKAR